MPRSFDPADIQSLQVSRSKNPTKGFSITCPRELLDRLDQALRDRTYNPQRLKRNGFLVALISQSLTNWRDDTLRRVGIPEEDIARLEPAIPPGKYEPQNMDDHNWDIPSEERPTY